MVLNCQKVFSHIHRWSFSAHEHYMLLWESSKEIYSLLLSISILYITSPYLQTLKVGKQPAATARDVRLIRATLPYFPYIPKLLPLNLFFIHLLSLH